MKTRMSLSRMVLYSVGELYGGGAFMLIGTLYLKFLTDTVLMAGALAGLILFIGKMWDAVTDPVMGLITDRTKSRHGRRRIYFLLGMVPIAVSFMLLWVPVTSFGNSGKLLFYLLTQLFFRTAFTFVMVPYSTLLAEMSDDYAERTKLTGVKIAFSNIGGLISGVVPLMIVTSFVSASSGYLIMGMVFGIFYALPWVLVYFNSWERKQDVSFEHEAGIPIYRLFASNLMDALRNRSFRIQLGLYTASYVALDTIMALTIYFLSYNLQMESQFNAVLGIMVITQTCFLPVYIMLSNKHGKKYAFVLGITIWATASLTTLLMQPGQPVYAIYLLGFFYGLGASGATFAPWAMLPEITDVDELIYGSRREGLYSGMMTFIRKIAQSLALAMIGIILDLIGYIPNTTQSTATLAQMRLIYALVPFGLFVTAAMFAWRFPVSPESYAMLKQEIELRKQGKSLGEVDPKVRTACEEMTGMKLEQLWKRELPVAVGE